jgi:signal transduction histidine kinase
MLYSGQHSTDRSAERRWDEIAQTQGMLQERQCAFGNCGLWQTLSPQWSAAYGLLLKQNTSSEVMPAAHELKTAVAVVRSTVQVLGIRLRSAEEYQSGLDQVLADNEGVEELVSRMLTLARFEERSGSPPEPIDLSQHLEAAAEKLGKYAETKGVQIRSSFEQGVPVRLPPEGAQILSSNLILNAIQHSPKGSEVIVSVRPRGIGHRQAWLVVQGFGSGIAPENLSKIFDCFYREDPSRSRETGGFGLGLAICKSIVEAAGGEIRVQSVLDQGTVVTVSLRLS